MSVTLSRPHGREKLRNLVRQIVFIEDKSIIVTHQNLLNVTRVCQEHNQSVDTDTPTTSRW
jgi:hypothetical protein